MSFHKTISFSRSSLPRESCEACVFSQKLGSVFTPGRGPSPLADLTEQVNYAQSDTFSKLLCSKLILFSDGIIFSFFKRISFRRGKRKNPKEPPNPLLISLKIINLALYDAPNVA